jgi:copper transport protein
VRRFSVMAMGAVGVLLAAGVALSILQLDEPSQVLVSPYGRIWLVKVAGVVLLLGLAGLNRQVLTPRLARSAGATTALRRSIGAELALVAGIVMATALLAQVPPPRASVAHEQVDHAQHAPASGSPDTMTGYEAEVSARGYTARLRIDPARPGRNTVTVMLVDKQGRPVSAPEVTAQLSLPEAGVEPLERRLTPSGAGSFVGEVETPLAGRWSVRIDALVSDFEKVVFRAELVIAPPSETR